MTARDPVDVAAEWDGVGPLAPVWRELARRLGASDRPVRKITVTGLDNQGRRKLASLLGLQRVPSDLEVAVDPAKIAAALGLTFDGELRAFVERLHGPIENRAALRVATSEARASLWALAEERIGARVPATLARIRAAGVPGGDIAAHEQVLNRLATTLDCLPLVVPTPLPMLAWRVSADPHALDSDTLCGRYLQLAAFELSGAARTGQGPDSVTVRRALLDIGVVVDRISSTISTYGLRASPDSALGRLLEAAAELKYPVNISGAMLDGAAAAFSQRAWLCVENPSLVEAATLGGYEGPIVCTSGWPSTDAQRLLDLARSQGIELLYAGDYDSAGLAIATFMTTRHGANILMTAGNYLAANLESALAWNEADAIPPTPWDALLAVTISERLKVVYQEDPAVWRTLVATPGIGVEQCNRVAGSELDRGLRRGPTE